MKKNTVLLLIIILSAFLSGCGHVGSAKEVHSYAKETYGNSIMLDSESHGKISPEAYTTITCQDKQYGFTYFVTSYMADVGLDGATFYHKPAIRTDFETAYNVAIYESIKDKIPAIEAGYNVIYEPYMDYYNSWDNVSFFGYVKAYDSSSAGNAAVEIGKLYKEADSRCYFTTNRKSYNIPQIRGLKMDARDKNDTLGNLSIADFKWESIEEYYIKKALERARTYDETAKYIGQHDGVFSDSGASLDDVTGGRDHPTSMDSPVIFYEFVTDSGKEFWVTDFIVKPEYGEHKGAWSNF